MGLAIPALFFFMSRTPLIDIDLPKPILYMTKVLTSLFTSLSMLRKKAKATKSLDIDKIWAEHASIVARYKKACADPFGKNSQIYASSKTILELIELIERNL